MIRPGYSQALLAYLDNRIPTPLLAAMPFRREIYPEHELTTMEFHSIQSFPKG